ncbi:MAG: hypothetical protein NUV50_05805 [Rhodospirillales bacterium]|nr:hypothetical protein [Rhodospirillales bacterium]
MTDPLQPGLDDDPLQVNDIIAEAAAVQQDVQALQAEVEAWQSETETWQDETTEAQATMMAETSPSASNASAPHITPEQMEALKQRLSNAAAPKGKTTAAKKLPDPDA